MEDAFENEMYEFLEQHKAELDFFYDSLIWEYHEGLHTAKEILETAQDIVYTTISGDFY